jgi:SAM-dependent methyltransferase
MARIDRGKRAMGTAVKRNKPSQAAEVLVGQRLVRGRVLDYGCGFGFDADYFGWESYDPFYRPKEPDGEFDTVICTLVLNALSRNNRAKALEKIRRLLATNGIGYLGVARNVPVTGKMGVHHSLQNYVVLSLPLVFEDEMLAIYAFRKADEVKDKTKDHVSSRDRRRDR